MSQDPSRVWRSVDGAELPVSEEETSGNSFEQPRYIKHTSTPKSKRPTPRRENRSDDEEDTDGSSVMKKSERSTRSDKGRGSRGHVGEERKRRPSRRRRRKLDDPRFKGERKRRTSDSSFSGKRLSIGDASEKSERKRNSSQEGDDDEVPITEILKRAQTRYERPQPLTELTTDKIYIQGRDGFSVVKCPVARAGLGEEKTGDEGMKRVAGIVRGESFPPIRVAVLGQKFWKSTGLVYQGLLAGMALMHFIMMYVFFDPTAEFVMDYSRISEIYSTVFSFLIALCTVAVFDKFDLARFGVQHLREVYTDYSRSLISVPLYLAIFCLHQFSLRTEDRLALVEFTKLNDSIRGNGTNFDAFLAELNGWKRVTVSKDLLAVVAWLFVSLGMKEDAFLTHLQSMEKNDEVSDR